MQSTMLTQYGQTVESGIWEYRENVILPALLARFTDAQVSLYAAMSEAVENGTNRFFAYSVTDEEFDAVLQTYRLSNPLSALAEFTFVPEEGVVEVDYVLSEEAHLAAIENWHELVERIVTHALVQGNEVQTAAQLYQYLTETLDFPPEADAEATDAAAEWLPEAGSENAVFYPSAYYALSENIVSENDAASIYAYLLMQVGVECMLIQEAPQAANADAELAETEPSEPHIWAVFALNDQWNHRLRPNRATCRRKRKCLRRRKHPCRRKRSSLRPRREWRIKTRMTCPPTRRRRLNLSSAITMSVGRAWFRATKRAWAFPCCFRATMGRPFSITMEKPSRWQARAVVRRAYPW